ncbi:MAG: hypothetical protein A3E85_00225 [Gammaproteobacteria bacterium RIFCSPHIGHO2_12_FULL_45_12]|nr:MAG: hypothetical protein A3E85_00225 [Gammaproteobacteria bacterium RIFCSPHIGHO2_12_FULL_45_12]
MSYADSIKFLIAMIVMMNPLGSLSIFLQLTHRSPLKFQRQMAIRCGFSMLGFMALSVWGGGQLLDMMGITISSFRFAGGIILLLVGLSMLQSHESALNNTPEDNIAAENRESIAVVPMTLPIIIGPGAISTLVLASNDYPLFQYKLWMTVICAVLALGMCLMLYFGSSITKLVGESVIKVITRIMGMVIMALAVNMLFSGLLGLIPALR